MDIGVIMDYRVVLYTLELFHIKGLNVSGPELLQHDTTCLEVWDDNAFDHVGIRGIGCNGGCRLYNLKPLEHEVREQYIFRIHRLFQRKPSTVLRIDNQVLSLIRYPVRSDLLSLVICR